jgi:uncharacterized protein (DUF58 family)
MSAIRPTARTLWLFGPGLLIAAAAVARWPALLALLALANGLLLIALAVDARAARAADLRITRELPSTVMRGKAFWLGITVENRSRRAVRLTIEGLLPADLEPRALRIDGRAAAGATLSRSFKLAGRRRGRLVLSPLTVTVTGPLGLARVTRVDLDDGASVPLAVIADVSAVGRFEALRRQRRQHEMGIAQARARGQGTEIDALRPYATGDPYAAISWKATARRNRPVVRETRAERRQNVLLALDCGRRMAREVDGRSRLDHAIEAALLLGDVAIRSDDRVGLIAFADRIVTRVAPRNDPAHLHRLATATHDLQPTLREPPYLAITSAILAAFPRRGLTVLFTDAMEPSALESLAVSVRHLSVRHLVLIVLFKDEYIERSRREPIAQAADLFRAGAAADLGLERAKAIETLRRSGALVIETAAESLSTSVVNRYLEVKAAHLI